MTHQEFQSYLPTLQALLHATAGRFFPSESDRNDVVQDALERLWQMVDELRMPPDALARAMARNLCIDRKRWQRPTSDISQYAETLPTPTNDSPSADRLLAVMAHLPQQQQLLLRLRHMEDYSTEALSDTFQSNPAAIRKALSRARQQLLQLYLKQQKSQKL